VHRSMAYRPVLPRLQYGCSKRPSYRLRRQSLLIEYDKGGSNCGMVSYVFLFLMAHCDEHSPRKDTTSKRSISELNFRDECS
jgi:hypothetical protein